MPIYEFQCEECGFIFEELVSSRDLAGDDWSSYIRCKKCQSERISKVISKVAFKSEGKFVSASGAGCSSCSGGTCSSCK